MTTIVCSQCGLTSTSIRDGTPWCLTCECWLTPCELTGEWVSYAEREHRKTQARNTQLIDQTRRGAFDALPLALTLIPNGWTAQVTQIMPGAYWTLEVHPPTAPIDVYAYLRAPHSPQPEGWYVAIYNRTSGVDFPLYTTGGVRAAYYVNVLDAIAAAVHAVRSEHHRSR